MKSFLGLHQTIPSGLWDASLQPQRLVYLHILQVVTNLVFTYSVKDIVPRVLILWIFSLGGVRREAASEE